MPIVNLELVKELYEEFKKPTLKRIIDEAESMNMKTINYDYVEIAFNHPCCIVCTTPLSEKDYLEFSTCIKCVKQMEEEKAEVLQKERFLRICGIVSQIDAGEKISKIEFNFPGRSVSVHLNFPLCKDNYLFYITHYPRQYRVSGCWLCDSAFKKIKNRSKLLKDIKLQKDGNYNLTDKEVAEKIYEHLCKVYKGVKEYLDFMDSREKRKENIFEIISKNFLIDKEKIRYSEYNRVNRKTVLRQYPLFSFDLSEISLSTISGEQFTITLQSTSVEKTKKLIEFLKEEKISIKESS